VTESRRKPAAKATARAAAGKRANPNKSAPADRRALDIMARTAATLEAIEQRNGELAAFVGITRERALAQAAVLDGLQALGAVEGPLVGMPLAVKDIIDLAGSPTQAGSLTRKQAPPATESAHVVRRLEAAGMVVVGKTHTVEYAFGGYGTNLTVGTPRNPWDLGAHRVPGGSSSGSGVAVGAGLLPAAFGTDTGGSVRIPAAMCGCVGHKTSFGLVGRSGVVPLSQSLDTVGPIAADVTTAAHMVAALQGHDPADPATDGVAPIDPIVDLERGAVGLRIGRVAAEDMPLLDPVVARSFERAVRLLELAGAQIVPFKMPESFDELLQGTGVLIAAEGYANHRAHVDAAKPLLAAPVLARMRAGKQISAADYIAANENRRRSIARFLAAMDRLDAIVLPTCPVLPMTLEEVDETVSPLAAHTRFANFLELCGLAVPIDVTERGLPSSLQIVGRRFDDALVLRIGRAFEKVRGAFGAAPA
jgi:aspartyl-tRNA(Asn)/glutamyl-tRNA(Gln) amidotransferase subunit A